MQRMSMTKWQLCSLLTANGSENATVKLPDGRTGYLQSIMREDGSGRSFLAKFMVPVWGRGGDMVEVLVRTTD